MPGHSGSHKPIGDRLAVGPLTRKQVRSVDQRAIDEFGMSGLVLMENAGRNASEIIRRIVCEWFDDITSIKVAIVCGKGNNAGDGFVIARHLQVAGIESTLLLVGDPDDLSHDAKVNYEIAVRSGLTMHRFEPSGVDGFDVIVDALLGTGICGAPRETYRTAIQAINKKRSAGTRVVSVDIPSGLDCDTGKVHSDAGQSLCIQADLTITFVAHKVGFSKAQAASYCGRIEVTGIGAPAKLLSDYVTERCQ